MDLVNRDEAWAALHRPDTSAQDLAAIGGAYPEFAATVADHPNAYPGLREWAAGLQAPVVAAAAAVGIPGPAPVATPAAEPPRMPGAVRSLWIAGFVLFLLATAPFWLFMARWDSSTLAMRVVPWGEVLAFALLAVAAFLSRVAVARRVVAGSLFLVLMLVATGLPLFFGSMGSLLLSQTLMVPGFIAWALAWPIRGAGWAGIAFLVPAALAGFSVIWYVWVAGFMLLVAGVLCAVLWSRGATRRAAARAARAGEASTGAAPGITVVTIPGGSGAPDTVLTLQGIAGAPSQRTSTLAVVAFIMAFAMSLVGAILGHVALSGIRRTGEGGRGLALAAVIIGWCVTALWVAGAIVYVVLIASLFR